MNEALGHLLVVDDNEMNRDMLSRRLTRRGYTVTTAKDGRQALDLIADGAFDLVLLDIMMPGLSGWDVLKQVRQTRSRLELPIIMATAKDQTEDIVRALREGANDYVTKPLDLDVVLARVGTHVILKVTHQNLQSANRRLKVDLAAAARVQKAHLPPKTPRLPGCVVAWHYRPCDDLGGDFLNAFDLGSDHVGLYMLDVSGHGVPAALMAVAMSRALAPSRNDTCIVSRPNRSSVPPTLRITPPGRVAEKLNSQFPIDPKTGQYFTLVYGLFEHRTRIFRFVSAGHTPIVQIPRGGPPQLVLGAGGPPVGLFEPENGAFPGYREHQLQLQPGDRLVFYSDGVLEAVNQQGQPFGNTGLLNCLAGVTSMPLQDAVDVLADSVLSHANSEEGLQDDVSILAIEVAS